MNFLLPVLIGIATAAGAGMILPQVLRVHRSQITDGVSAAWVGVGVMMNAWWTLYAAQGQLWGLLPVSVLGLALYTYLAKQLMTITQNARFGQLVLGAGSAAILPLTFLVVEGWDGAGLAIGLCYAVQFAPAVVEATRSENVAGISPITWILALVEAVIWFIYGTTNGDLALLIGGGGGTIMSAIILLRLLAVARSEPATPAEPEGATESYVRLG